MSTIVGSVSAAAGWMGAFVAATALRRNREDQARRDAAGLHASVQMIAQRYPPGQELQLDGEPSDRPAEWLVVKVTNAAAHPYYAVVASVFLASRQVRFAARADIVPPLSARFARLTQVDGCDTVGMAGDTLVETTFVDSQGRGWRRGADGKLDRRNITRKWAHTELDGRPNRGAALHRIRERVERDDQGYEWHRVRDAADHEVEVTVLERPAGEDEEDAKNFPSPLRQPRTRAMSRDT